MSEKFEVDAEFNIYEVRGYDDKWRVWYPSEDAILSPVKVFDKEGELKSIIYAGGEAGKLTESFVEWPTAKMAVEYAKELGAENIKLIRTQKKKKRKKNE